MTCVCADDACRFQLSQALQAKTAVLIEGIESRHVEEMRVRRGLMLGVCITIAVFVTIIYNMGVGVSDHRMTCSIVIRPVFSRRPSSGP
jgi:hypothetical protein